MPFRHLSPEQFDLDTMRRMQTAFDDVCQRLSLGPEDPRRSPLATTIIELAASGEQELAAKATAKISTPSVHPPLLSLGRKHAP